MKMYPSLSLYKHYLNRALDNSFSNKVPDVTKKITLNNINYSINLCNSWDTFMDIGGGNGHYSTALSALFKKGIIVEVESAAEHLEVLEKYPNLEIYNDFIENFETTEKFDFILLSDIFEHIKDISNFIEKISHLQKTGGVVYILTPNPITCAPAPESGLYFTRHPNGHIKHYDKKEIVFLLKRFGYQLEFIIYEERDMRQSFKRIIRALSRRDQLWKNKLFYKIIRPVFLFILKPVLKIFEIVVYRHENKSTKFNSRSQGLAFKKI